MSTNCFVKKFKEVIDNDNLKKLGVITIKIHQLESVSNDEQLKIYIQVQGKVTVKAIGNGQIGTNPSTKYQEITLENTNLIPIYHDNAEYSLEISPKYNVSKLELNRWFLTSNLKNKEVDLTDVPFIPLTSLNTYNQLTSGDISNINMGIMTDLVLQGDVTGTLDFNGNNIITRFVTNQCNNLRITLDAFKHITSVETIRLVNSAKVIGAITDLNKCVNLKEITLWNVGGLNVTGSIDDFVAGQIANGRTSVSSSNPIYIHYVTMYCTFGGLILRKEYCHLIWNNVSKVAIYEGSSNFANCSTVYCKGYTQSEAEAAFSGKTIIRVDA